MLNAKILSSANIHKEARDWSNRVITNGGSVSASTLKAVSNFCHGIDGAGLRDRFVRLNLFCGNDLNACVVPLYRSLSFGGTLYGGSTDTNTNFIGTDYVETGSGGGLTTNTSPYSKCIDTDFTDNILFSTITNNQDSHMSLYMNYMTVSSTVVMGTQDYCNCYISYMLFGPPGSNYIENYMNSDCGANNYANGTVTTSYGLITNSCTGSSINYYNGNTSLLSGSTAPWSAPTGTNIIVMGTSYFDSLCEGYGIGNMDYTGTGCGYSFGKGLSSGQVSDYNTIMTTFQTALGRNA